MSVSVPWRVRRVNKALIIVLSVAGLVLASLSVAHSLGLVFPTATPASKPASVTVSGSVQIESGAVDPTIVFVDMADSRQSVSRSISGNSYTLTVRNQHWYYAKIIYSVPTNNCQTSPQGVFTCLTLPGICVRDPIYVDSQSASMRYDINCFKP